MAADTPMTVLDEVVVTGSREQTRLVETAASVSSIKEETIALDRPSHPMQVMSQMPGVAVAVTNGEGHQTAIRQPFTTSPVYLFLEDGIPSRSTGFFNHNALYELNIPQAGGIEVTKGPGSALYGSDAIGGLINVLTPTPPQTAEASVSLEAGDFGWRRALVSGGNASGDDAWRGTLNLTHTDGWRDKTAYDRQSGTLRWDRALDNQSVLKTVMSFSLVDQETGASSPLIRSDYENNPTKNYKPIAFRKVSAFRLSTNYEHETDNTLVSITPYYRNNSMDLLASFTLNTDRTVYNSANQSFGVAAKWRRDFAPLRARLIAGIDVDYSPGSREEDAITTTTSGNGVNQQFLAYSRGARVYDYKVAFKGVSPYMQGEFSPLDALRVTAGLRYDHIGYSFDNNLSSTVTANTRNYAQAGDTSISYNHLSPKLGATLALSSTTHAYANYSHGFRAPSESQLFRPTSSTTLADAVSQMQSALQLKPIKADQYELGLRGKLLGASYDASVYDLTKKDDIVSARNTATNESVVSNAGETRHRGIELGLGVPLSDSIRVDAAYSHAKHTYEKWVSSQGNYSGKEMASAPRNIANTRLTWSPSKGNRVQLEWVRLGKYWLDDANTATYEGHNILTLRGNWQVNKDVGLFASLYNLADKRWADSASISSSTVVYSPGMPRTLTAGVQLNWQ